MSKPKLASDEFLGSISSSTENESKPKLASDEFLGSISADSVNKSTSNISKNNKTKAMREKAGLGANFIAGLEQGVTGLTGMAVKAGMGAAHGKGALGKTSEALEYAFDPKHTFIANKYDFDDNNSTLNQGALIAGNILGEVGKVIGTGGLAAPAALAELGLLTAAKTGAKKIGKATAYTAAKQAAGLTGGMGASALSAKPINDYLANRDDLSAEDKFHLANILSTGTGLAGGVVSGAATRKAVRSSPYLSSARDQAASGLNIPSYNEIARMNLLKDMAGEEGATLGADVSQNIPKATHNIEKGSVGSAEATPQAKDIAKTEALKHALDLNNIAKEESHKGLEQLFPDELNNQLIRFTRDHNENIAKGIAAEKADLLSNPEHVEPKLTNMAEPAKSEIPFAEGHGYMTVAKDGAIDMHLPSTAGEILDAVDSGNFDRILEEGLGAQHHLQEAERMTKASPSEVEQVGEPHDVATLVKTAAMKNKSLQKDETKELFQTGVNDIHNGLTDFINNANKTEVGSQALAQWFNKHELNPDAFKDENGIFNAAKMSDLMQTDPVARERILQPTDKKTGSGSTPQGLNVAADYIHHLNQQASLSPEQAQKFAGEFLRKEVQEGRNTQAREELKQNGLQTLNNTEQMFKHISLPLDPANAKPGDYAKQHEAYDQLLHRVSLGLTGDNGNALNHYFDMITSEHSTLPNQYHALSDIGSLLNHSAKIMKAPQGAGYGHAPLAKQLERNIPDIQNQMLKIKMMDYVKENGEAPSSAEIKSLTKEIKNDLNKSSLEVPRHGKVNLLVNGSPTKALDDAAHAIFMNSNVHGFHFLNGRNLPAASYAKQYDIMAKSINFTNTSVKDIRDLIKTINRSQVYRKNTQSEVRPAIEPLMKSLNNALGEYYDNKYGNGAGEKAVDIFSKLRTAQFQNMQMKEAHPALKPQIMGAPSKLTGLNKFGQSDQMHTIPQQAEILKGTLDEVASKMKDFGFQGIDSSRYQPVVNDLQQSMKTIAQQEGILPELQSQAHVQAAATNSPAPEYIKNKNWRDVIQSIPEKTIRQINPSGDDQNSMAGLNLGASILKGNPDKTSDFFHELNRQLNSGYLDKSKKPKMIKELHADIRTGIDSELNKTVVDFAEKGHLNEGINSIDSSIGNLRKLYDKSKVVQDALKNTHYEMMLKTFPEKKDSKFVGQLHDILKQADKSDQPLATFIDKAQKINAIKDRTLNQLLEKDVKNIPAGNLTEEHLKHAANFQGRGKLGVVLDYVWAHSLVNLMLLKSVEKATAQENGKILSRSQQKALLAKDYLDVLSKPDMEAPNSGGKTNGQIFKEELAMAKIKLEELQKTRVKRFVTRNIGTLTGALRGAGVGRGMTSRQVSRDSIGTDRDQDLINATLGGY